MNEDVRRRPIRRNRKTSASGSNQVKSVERAVYLLLNDCAKSKTFDQILANEQRKQNHRQIDDDGGGTEFAPQHHSIRHQGRCGDRQSACVKICEKNREEEFIPRKDKRNDRSCGESRSGKRQDNSDKRVKSRASIQQSSLI